MEIVFVRHAEKDSNSFESGITKEGKREAKKLGEELSKENFDEFYNSDLSRCYQTSMEISGSIGKNPEAKTFLREIGFDILRKPKLFLPKEVKNQIKEIKKFLDEISKDRHKHKKVLICSHGNINKLILGHFLNIRIKKLVSFRQSHCGINRIYWKEKHGNWRVLCWNRIIESD